MHANFNQNSRSRGTRSGQPLESWTEFMQTMSICLLSNDANPQSTVEPIASFP